MTDKPTNAPDIFALLREMYPNFDDAQLLDARRRITAYVAVVLRIHERLEAERRSRTPLQALTDSKN